VGRDIGRPPPQWPGEPGLQLGHDARGNLVLYRKHVRQLAVEPLGPALVPLVGIDELRRDAHRIAGLAHAALEHRPYAQSAADLRHIEVLALKREGRGA